MTNRISYQPWDFKEVQQDEIKAKELLIDYTNNDIIIINANKKVFKFKEFIKSQLSDVLTGNHMDLYDQHLNATHEYSGFMSSKDKTKFDEIVKKFDDINTLMNNNLHCKYKIKNLEYNIAYGSNVSINCDIQFGPLLFKLSSILDVGNRPDTKYRDDLICILNQNDELSIVFINNSTVNRQTILYNNNEYRYNDKYKYYENNSDYIIPIIRIRRLNKDIVGADNIFGRIDDKLINITELYKIKEDVNDDRKIIKTNINIDKYFNEDTLYFLPLNGNDTEKVSNISIGKYSHYIPSPYGKMHLGSFTHGTIMPIEKVNNFVLEFMLKSKSKSDKVISLLDENFNDLYNIETYSNKVVFKINDVYNRVSLDTNHEYSIVRLCVNEDDCKVYINDKFVKKISKSNKYIKNVRIDATNIALGNVIISKDLNFSSNIIDDSVDIIDSFNTLSDKVFKNIHREIKLTVPGNYKLEYDNISTFVDDNIITGYDFNKDVKVIDIKGNIVTLNKPLNINKGEIVKILSRKLENYENVYEVIDKFSNTILILDKCVESKCLGYHIFDINDGTFIKATINGESLKSLKIKDNILTGIYKDGIKPDSVLVIDYIVKENANHNIKSIDTVLFDDTPAIIYGDKIREITNSLIPINIDGSNYNNSKLLYVSNNNVISANINININDFVLNPINRCFDSVIKLFMSSGSNSIKLNDSVYNRGNVVSEYIEKLDIINGKANLDISTEVEKANAKLFVDMFTFGIKFKSDKNFILLDEYGRILEYLSMYKNEIFTNTNKEITIICGGDNQ